jgi:hypothetical protein
MASDEPGTASPLESIATPTLSSGLPATPRQTRLTTVQRLFSMFPTGAAGVALILLRVSVAATLLTGVLTQGDPGAHIWQTGALGLLSLAVCLGLFTPMCSIACCLVEAAMLLDVKNLISTPLFSSILVAASLGLLGPGAYSLDARMFGRRLVISSSDKTTSGD